MRRDEIYWDADGADGVDIRVSAEQAEGLCRLFAAEGTLAVPVVANPHGVGWGLLLERLATAFAEAGAKVLVVDAADGAPPPLELAALDLAACVERLTPRVAYLGARGLPHKHRDAQGSCATFLDLLTVACPSAQVTLVHAAPQTLVRLFHAQAARAVLLAADTPGSITHAYASMRLLAERCDWRQFDLQLGADPLALATARTAQRLGECAQAELGAAQPLWAAVDPAGDVQEPIGTQLQRLVSAQWPGPRAQSLIAPLNTP